MTCGIVAVSKALDVRVLGRFGILAGRADEEEAGLRVSCASKKDRAMAEAIYKVGDRVVMRTHGKVDGTLEVKAVITGSDLKRRVHAKVIELVQGYSGKFKVGTMLNFPEDEFVGTFTPKK